MERAVPLLLPPPPLLNLQVQTFNCTIVSREQTLPVSRALFCAVCCVKQLHNAVQWVNGSQSDKRRQRCCIESVPCTQSDGGMDWLQLLKSTTDWLAGGGDEACRTELAQSTRCSRDSSQINCLVNPTSVCHALTELLVWVHNSEIGGRRQWLVECYCKVSLGRNDSFNALCSQ